MLIYRVVALYDGGEDHLRTYLDKGLAESYVSWLTEAEGGLFSYTIITEDVYE